ncbi:MAG: PEGA domain-containing protein, partial [Phycisphaerae bacterium]|nr:PEGA domain-containing protein [Phycisphaerae bacterium]
SRWVHAGPTVDYGYGIMHLVDNSDSQTLILAAKLTDYSVEQLMTDPIANIRGGAAVIAHCAAATVGQPQALEDYWEALKSFSGLNPEVQAKQAAAYYQVLAEGASADNNLGMQIELAAEAVDLSAIGTEDDDLAVESTDYGPAIWNAADSSNYSTSRGASIDRWVNHWVGTGTYAGAISWFKNPASNVSAHFVIRKSDGQLTQMVRIAHKAWHCGNWNSRSIGIEHEATPSNPWPTDSSAPMLVVSATACRHFCDAYGMPKTRTYVVGHNEVPGSSTSCPGPMPWTTYMNLVTGTSPTPPWDATYQAQSYPSSMTAGTTAVVWAEFVNKGTEGWYHAQTYLGTSSPQDRSSPFCESGNWNGCNRPSEVDQWQVLTNEVGRFTFIIRAPDTPGTYTEKYKLVREGVTWFGPEITWTINVTAANGNLTGTVTNASTGAAVSGATVSLGSAGSTTTNTSGVYTISNVPAGTYTATVSKTGFNNASGSVSITAGSTTTKDFTLTPSDTQAPTVPTGLSANATGPTTVALTWTASTDNVGVTGYDIRRDGTTIGSSTGASYTDNSATANTTHSYQVRAKDAVPNYSAWCTAADATTPPAPPSPTVVFSDGFNGNLNNWTQQVAGFAYSTDANRGGLTGAGAAFVAAGEADQMYKTFTRPFAQGVASGYFWDGKGGWKTGSCGWAYRQSLSLREPGGTAGFILDNCFASNVGNPDYYYRYLCCGWASTYTSLGLRDVDTDCNGTWVHFETTITPAA